MGTAILECEDYFIEDIESVFWRVKALGWYWLCFSAVAIVDNSGKDIEVVDFLSCLYLLLLLDMMVSMSRLCVLR